MARYKVLSTRPLDPSLVEQAKQQDVELVEQDFISVTPIISEEVDQQIKPWTEKTEPSYVVFTSANGVEAVRQYVLQHSVTQTPNWKVFCISGRTREAISKLLPSAPVLGTAEYGATLAPLILNHTEVTEVVFFCGNKRREELPAILKEAGIRVHEIVVYQTEETPLTIKEALDGVLFFSPSAVSSFFSANQLNSDTVCFAIGTTTAEALKHYTTNKIITSATTTQASMLEAVQHYFHSINCKK
jgi:uroporphyrinogen-III synthase